MSGVIKLQKLMEEKTVIEEENLFKDSTFKFVYEKAKLLIEKIISKEEANSSELGYDQCIQELQIDNIISFEGRRGTGKTSVMSSICKALKQNKKTNFVKKQIKGGKEAEVEFIVLDFIDASMLETGEDILDIILANMFLKLKFFSEIEYDISGYNCGDYEKRELYKLFDEIYGSLRKSKGDEKYKATNSPLSLLNNLSNSQILKDKIFQLVQKYLKYMEMRNKYSDQNIFLVISVDDLDMYFQTKESSPFEVLETLHRYFMIPGVIILLTYNYQDLCIGCQKHFYQNYHEQAIRSENVENIEKCVENWTEQYLKKVLPIHSRIYMPSLKKHDYSDANDIQIEVTKEELDEILRYCDNAEALGKGQYRDKEIITFPIKRFAMLLKAAVANLYYDTAGQKKHFIEPTTIRELAQLYIFVQQLQRLYEKMNSEKTEYEGQENKAENFLFKELFDDLYFRYAKVKLGVEEEREFSNYLEVPVERRSKDILNVIEFHAEENISEIEYVGGLRTSYSYGELLYSLYKAKRMRIFSRELLCCILDSYTIVLTKFYRKLRDGNEKYRTRLLTVLGSSVAGSWSNLLVPKVNIRGREENNTSLNHFEIANHSNLRKIGAKKFSNYVLQWNYALSGEYKNVIEEFRMLEILLMFFTDVYHVDDTDGEISGFKIQYKYETIYKNVDGQDAKYHDFKKFVIEISYGCFNVMNFVNNLFRAKSYFEEIHECLLDAYMDYFDDCFKTNLTRESMKAFLAKNSLYELYVNWFKGTNGLAMPVYSFDMMYNIMKRECQNNELKSAYVSSESLWDSLKIVYKEIGELLKQQDEYYFRFPKNKPSTPFYDSYSKSPFIDYITLLDEALWKVQFDAMISAVASPLDPFSYRYDFD